MLQEEKVCTCRINGTSRSNHGGTTTDKGVGQDSLRKDKSSMILLSKGAPEK